MITLYGGLYNGDQVSSPDIQGIIKSGLVEMPIRRNNCPGSAIYEIDHTGARAFFLENRDLEPATP